MVRYNRVTGTGRQKDQQMKLIDVHRVGQTAYRALTAGAALTAVLVATAVTAGTAWADSGSIAGAPTVAVGHQEFGNTGSVTPLDSGVRYRTYWLLPVTSGDKVTIDWESQVGNTVLDVFPGGTTDYNVDNTNTLQEQYLNDNDKNELEFQVTSTTTLPLLFSSGDGWDNPTAPYDFTVSLRHAMVLSTPSISNALSGTVTAGIHSPDGTPLSGSTLSVSLQVSASHVPWTTIGSANPVNGLATIAYKVPASLASKRVTFRFAGSGAGYSSATSGGRVVTLAAAAPKPKAAPKCVVPKVVGDRLGVAEQALRHAHCRPGKVGHRHTRHARHGRVLSQSVAAGRKLADGSKVNLTVGR
jgi:hypothetical protein